MSLFLAKSLEQGEKKNNKKKSCQTLIFRRIFLTPFCVKVQKRVSDLKHIVPVELSSFYNRGNISQDILWFVGKAEASCTPKLEVYQAKSNRSFL